jgi:hypothetical protein
LRREREVRAMGGGRRGWGAAAIRELRGRPLTWGTVAAFGVLGPILTRMIFPEVSLALAIFGGVVLGGFFAFCAIPDKLFE